MMYKISTSISMTDFEDGGKIVLNSYDGQYYHLDEATATFIEQLINGVNLEAYYTLISNKYSKDFSQVKKDYTEIIETLIKIKILEVEK